jgi:hypothetical protein
MSWPARLAVPPQHLGVLVAPAAAQIDAGLRRLPFAELQRVSLLGRPVSVWRAALRAQLGLAGPVIGTGHQADFFHAGVCAKLVAVSLLARHCGGNSVFLLVDSDLPRSAHLRVPEVTPDGLRCAELQLPASDPLRPVECQRAASRAAWQDFFARVTARYALHEVSLLEPFAAAWLSCAAGPADFCDALGRGLGAVARTLGLADVQMVRVSRFCQTAAFRAFAAELLMNALRSGECYNAAQAAYRARHRVRAANRPIPALFLSRQRVEVPLWVYRDDGPRARLYVAARPDHIDLFADQQPIGSLATAELADPDRHVAPWPIEQAGWRLRPRALALAAWARLLLADLFVHGVGGAQYDEITDDWLRRLFGVTGAPYGCVSATLHLPLPRSGVGVAEVRAARRACRDVCFNPQRHLPDLPESLLNERATLIRRSDELRRQDRRARAERRTVFARIRQVNEQLLGSNPGRVAEMHRMADALEQQWRQDQVALDREYFVALHADRDLEALVGRLAAQLDARHVVMPEAR